MRHKRSPAARTRRAGKRSKFRVLSREAPHASLDDFLSSLPDGDSFGDNPRIDRQGATRVIFQNVNGVPHFADHPKQQQINRILQEEQVGIALLAETNRRWSSVEEGNSWYDRMRRLPSKGHYSSVAFNKHESTRTSSFQYGGCLATVLDYVSHAVKSKGQDPTGLGRWSFIRLRGKSFPSIPHAPEDTSRRMSHDLIVISAYRPNPPGSGETTVWDQQRVYFTERVRNIDPRKAFTTDLSQHIKTWREQGCEIILGVDTNENLSATDPSSFREKMREVGLTEAILARHPLSTQSTYQRNCSNTPIDGIFVTAGVPVRAAGYYGFEELIQSDHRAIWVDFDLSTSLGGHRPAKTTFKPRKLVSTDKQAVSRYITQIQDDYRAYNVPARLSQLYTTIVENDSVMSLKLRRKFNCLHAQMYMIRKRAEANCRKVSNGQVPWSPRIQVMWDKMHLLRLLLKTRKKCKVSSRKIRRLISKTKLHGIWRKSTAVLRLLLKEERSLYKVAKKDHATLWRQQHVEGLLNKARRRKRASKKDMERFLRLQKMKQREETRRRRRARGKGFSGGLRAIHQERTNSSGEIQMQTITDRQAVEEACREENRKRYDQTRYPFITPPMDEPLYSTFTGKDRRTHTLALLEGRYDIPEEVDDASRAFLNQCRFHEGFSFTSMEVTPEDHFRFWTKMKEDKGAEPHGLHNGHFKAALASPMIYRCDTIMRNIPLLTSFVPEQWKNLMNFAIEKKPGDFRPSKMRTIQMMNPEFQANNKKMGKQAMRLAERHQLIPPGQCGARKQHQAKDLAVSKRLVWDLLLLQRRAAGWISNDAKSCFDRIVHWIAMVALLRFGITWRAVATAFDTLASSRHRVRTGFGDSEQIFYPPSTIPFQGCGQGNGAGPAIWVAVSSILITMMEAAGYGFECLTSISNSMVNAQCFAFIDDTDVIEAAYSVDERMEDILPQVQAAASLWSDGIRTTGGSINPEKSFCWLLDHQFDRQQGTWRLKKRSTLLPNAKIQIRGLSREFEELRRLEPGDSERTLGVMLAPEENKPAQAAHLRKIAQQWVANFRPVHLLRSDVLPLLRTTILKSLEYPMVVTTLNQKEWNKIMWPVLEASLPKAGVCRRFPRSYVMAPISLQGLGVPNPYASQIFIQLEQLLRHPANRTQTGRYLDAVLQAHQLETGTSYGILQQDYSNTAILATDTWIKRAWSMLESIDAYVAFDSPTLQLFREGDRLLNEVFIDMEVDQEDLRWLNWCAMFLRVRTVSDIVTADGRHIKSSSWGGERDASPVSPYQWPRCIRPSQQHWVRWRRFLSRTLLTSDNNMLLREPGGPWYDEKARWLWLYSPTAGLFHREGHLWFHFSPNLPKTRQTTCSIQTRSLWTRSLPRDVERATVRTGALTLAVESVGSSIKTPLQPNPSVVHEWRYWERQCSSHFGWVPDELIILGDEWELFGALLDNRLVIVSDGSYRDQVGTAAVQLLSRTGSSRIVALCQVPGQPEDQSAYRSELAGLMMGITIAQWLLSQWSTTVTCRPTVCLACDGKSALQACFDRNSIAPTREQFDIISTIRAIIHESHISFLPEHVTGHQDTKVTRPLTWLEDRNVEADELAVAYRQQLSHSARRQPENPWFFHEPATLFIKGVKQSSLQSERVQELVALPLLQERWSRYHTVPSGAEDEIDWALLRRTMRALTPPIQKWVTKHSVGICGVGRFMKDWKLEPTDECPLCGEREDHLHVPRCPDSRAEAEWNRRVADLKGWLQKNGTSHATSEAILHTVRGIRNPTLPPHRSPSPAVQRAWDSQQKIGQQGFLEGRLSHQWIRVHKGFLAQTKSRRSATLWGSRLAQQLIHIGHAMWLHRNSIKQSDDSVQRQRLQRQIDAGILAEFEMGTDGLSRLIQPKLSGSVERVLRKPLDDKVSWLKLVSGDRRAQRRAVASQVRMMRQFLISPA